MQSLQALDANRPVLEAANQTLTLLAIQEPEVYREAVANDPDIYSMVRDWVVLHQKIKRALARGRTV